MRIQSIALLCMLVVICRSLHLRWHQYHTLTSPADLRSKVEKVLSRLKNLNNTINSNVSSMNPYNILDRIDSLENIIKQSRLQQIEIFGQSQDTSSNTQYYCQSLSANDSNTLQQSMASISVSANLLSQQKAINVDNSSLKGLPTQIVETSQNITQLTNSQTKTMSTPPKIVYQPNLLAQNWALGSISMKDLNSQSLRQPGENNAYCPSDRPYPDSSNNCIQCLSTYNIQTKTCFACLSYDQQLHKCNDPSAPTNTTSIPSTSTSNQSSNPLYNQNTTNSSTTNQNMTANPSTTNQSGSTNPTPSINQNGTNSTTNPLTTNQSTTANTSTANPNNTSNVSTANPNNTSNVSTANPNNTSSPTTNQSTTNTTPSATNQSGSGSNISGGNNTGPSPNSNITGTPTNSTNSSSQSTTTNTTGSNNTSPIANQTSGGLSNSSNGTSPINSNVTTQVNPNGTNPTSANGSSNPTPSQRVSSPTSLNGVLLPANQTIQDYKNSLNAANKQPNTLACPDATPFFDGTSCIQCLKDQFFSTVAMTCQTCPSNQIYNISTCHCDPILYYSNPQNKFWTSIGRSPSDILKDINATSQNPNARSCPPEKPYFTGKQCILCSSPKPIYSYDGSQCTGCIAPAVFDPNIYSCATPQKMQTNPSTSPSLIMDGRSLNEWRVYYYNNQTADPQISDCPSSKPYFDGIVCISCPAQQPYFNLQYRVCQSCPLNTEYDVSVRDCLSTSGNIVTQSPNVLKMAAGIFA